LLGKAVHQSRKSYAERFLPPVIFAKEYLANAACNVRLLLASDFHMESGKKELIAALYRSIVGGSPVPSRTGRYW